MQTPADQQHKPFEPADTSMIDADALVPAVVNYRELLYRRRLGVGFSEGGRVEEEATSIACILMNARSGSNVPCRMADHSRSVTRPDLCSARASKQEVRSRGWKEAGP